MSSRFTWLRNFLSSYRRPFVVALALGLIASGFSALLMFTSGYLISATAQEGVTLFSIMLPVAFVQIFGLGRPLARYLERLVSHSWVLRVTSDLRRMLYRHVAGNASDPARARAAGEYLSVLSDDIAHLQNLYLRVVFPAVIALLLSFCAAIAFGLFSPAFACIMLVIFLGTVVGLPLCTLAATRLRSQRVKEMRSECISQLADDMIGRNDWLLSGRAREELARLADADAVQRELDCRVRSLDRTIELVSFLILALAVCAVVAWSGSSFGGDLSTANWIAAFTLGFFPLIESFAVLPAVISTSTEHMQSVDRLMEVSGEVVEAGFQEPFPVSEDASIKIEGVTYSYPDAPAPAISALDLAIPAGQNVAVLGRSGSGKTTLASLVRGMLEPQSGQIAIGGNEMHARSFDVSGTIGHLSQEPYLFNKTLRSNLALARPDASDDELVSILCKVGLGNRFDALPDGLNTVIGETGAGFSGGEAHRIALARALVADVRILIVDEPFSALDTTTESQLVDTLLDTCRDRTLIVITHHLAHVNRFDRVIFLENGNVALDGSPAELAQTSPRFLNLIEFDRDFQLAITGR